MKLSQMGQRDHPVPAIIRSPRSGSARLATASASRRSGRASMRTANRSYFETKPALMARSRRRMTAGVSEKPPQGKGQRRGRAEPLHRLGLAHIDADVARAAIWLCVAVSGNNDLAVLCGYESQAPIPSMARAACRRLLTPSRARGDWRSVALPTPIRDRLAGSGACARRSAPAAARRYPQGVG